VEKVRCQRVAVFSRRKSTDRIANFVRYFFALSCANNSFMTERLVTIEELSTLSGLPIRTLRTLMARNTIPFLKLGFRTVRFQPSKVEKALAKREVTAI
jgi:excisionase family DNA binding protein